MHLWSISNRDDQEESIILAVSHHLLPFNSLIRLLTVRYVCILTEICLSAILLKVRHQDRLHSHNYLGIYLL